MGSGQSKSKKANAKKAKVKAKTTTEAAKSTPVESATVAASTAKVAEAPKATGPAKATASTNEAPATTPADSAKVAEAPVATEPAKATSGTNEAPAATPADSAEVAESPVATEKDTGSANKRKHKVCIVTYSMYGHINIMAEEEKKGLEEAGIDVTIFRVPETLPDEVLEKMHAPPKPDYPVIKAEQLAEYDGIMFGIPTRFGMACAQMKSFMDSTGGLWGKQVLAGKPAGIFVSTAVQGGGQETTALTWITQLTHHGMYFVPLGYSSPGTQYDLSEPHGGSPYGAGCLAGGDGSRQPSENEKQTARTQGQKFGKIVALMAA